MKKQVVPFLMILLLLAGCQHLYPDEYLSVSEHAAPFAYRETETQTPTAEKNPGDLIPVVSRHSDIRDAIQNMVVNGEESGMFLLQDYVGSIEWDMKNMYNEMLENEPKYVYAMDDPFEWDVKDVDVGKAVFISMKLRLTPQEVQMIPTKMYAPVLSEVQEALVDRDSSYTVQVSGYQETDISALLDQYILDHPEDVAEPPDISVSVFPNRGSIRVLEVRFVYHTDKDTLSKRVEETRNYLDMVNNQIYPEQRADEIVETLYKHLIPAIDYRNNPEATAFSLLVRKSGGNSRVMSSVVAYLCNCADTQCEIVVGERDGVPWYWNRIMTEAGWRSFDMHASALEGKCPVLIRSDEMIGYTWDPIAYPELEVEEPTEPKEPTEPTDPGESTEPSEPGESTESSDPTEPSEPAEPVETTEPIPTEPTKPSETITEGPD